MIKKKKSISFDENAQIQDIDGSITNGSLKTTFTKEKTKNEEENLNAELDIQINPSSNPTKPRASFFLRLVQCISRRNYNANEPDPLDETFYNGQPTNISNKSR